MATPIKHSIVYLRFDEVKASKFQPTQRASIKIPELAKLIQEKGLLDLPTIDKDYNLIDGHRRIAAMKFLGWKGCNFMRVNASDEKGDLLHVTNIGQLKLTANQEIDCYFAGGVVRQRTQSSIQQLIAIDEKVKDILIEKKPNPVTLHYTFQIVRKHIGKNHVTDQKLLSWILQNSLYKIKHGITAKISKQVFIEAVKNDIPMPNINSSRSLSRVLLQGMRSN